MSNNLAEITEIFERCIKGTATPSERDLFYDWVELPENRDQAIILWENAFTYSDGSLDMDDTKGEGIFEAILSTNKDLPHLTADLKSAPISFSVPPAHRVHFLKTSWVRYAAAIILVFGIIAYLLNTAEKTEPTLAGPDKYLQTDIAPGRDRAVLTLANGKQIALDSARGNIIRQGSLTVINLAGKLKYEGTGTGAEYNIITTPNGGQYQIVLPDGSRVWLNAASSVKFPTAFRDSIRHVEVTGEAYMEVAGNTKQPFVAKVNGVELQVLGTSFNVNAYADEDAIRTTLVTGSVKVISIAGSAVAPREQQGMRQKGIVLKPGQQCSAASGQSLMVASVDIDQVLAWKNGTFYFKGATVEEFMRQLARWYDLKVVYRRKIPEKKFTGKMGRDLLLSEMLETLTYYNIKYRREGKTLIIEE